MMDDDTAAGAAEPGKNTADANDASTPRARPTGSDTDPVVESLLARLLWSNSGPLPPIGDHKFKASLLKLAKYAEDERLMLFGGILNALDPEPRRKFYREVAHELAPLLVEALTEAGQGSAAQRVQKGIKAALAPGKRGRPAGWSRENRLKAFYELFHEVMRNPKQSATEAWKKVAEKKYWKDHSANMGGTGPVYRHLQEGVKGLGKDLEPAGAISARDLTRMINGWRERAMADPGWRKAQMEKARRSPH
jgi:hypothetical protein